MSRRGTSDAANIGEIRNVDMSVGYKGSEPVNVKNNGSEAVTLSVHMFDMPQGEYVETTFYPGWNPEIIDEIQANPEVFNIQVGL